jgi:hypothetical protein
MHSSLTCPPIESITFLALVGELVAVFRIGLDAQYEHSMNIQGRVDRTTQSRHELLLHLPLSLNSLMFVLFLKIMPVPRR